MAHRRQLSGSPLRLREGTAALPLPPAPHIVVLDGSPLFAEVISSLFASQGYQVSTLSECTLDPSEVLGLQPSLIVLDLRCGVGLAGLDFLRRLRAIPAGRGIPVLASTPASLLDMERLGEELRALNTPIFDGVNQLDDLLATAASTIGQARVRCQ